RPGLTSTRGCRASPSACPQQGSHSPRPLRGARHQGRAANAPDSPDPRARGEEASARDLSHAAPCAPFSRLRTTNGAPTASSTGANTTNQPIIRASQGNGPGSSAASRGSYRIESPTANRPASVDQASPKSE